MLFSTFLQWTYQNQIRHKIMNVNTVSLCDISIRHNLRLNLQKVDKGDVARHYKQFI